MVYCKKKVIFPTLQEDCKASVKCHKVCVVPWAEVPNAIYVQRTFKNGHNCVLPLKHFILFVSSQASCMLEKVTSYALCYAVILSYFICQT